MVSGRLTPFLSDTRPATSTTVDARPGEASTTRSKHLAVVDQDPVAGRERAQDFRMGQIDARRAARGGVAVEGEVRRPCAGRRAPPANAPSLQLRALQVDEDADRAAHLLLERADRRHPLAHGVMRGVAHVDAEHVGAGGEQGGDGLAIVRGGAEGGDDLDAATATGLQWRSSPWDWRRSPHARSIAPVLRGAALFLSMIRAADASHGARASGRPKRLKGSPGRSIAPSSSSRPCRCRLRRSRCGRSRGRNNPAGP